MSGMEGNVTDLRRPNAATQFGRREMFFCLLCALCLFAAVAYFAGLGRGRAAGLCAGVAFAVVKLRWESREHLWFWSAISLSLTLQAIVIARVPFGGESMPVAGLLPAGLVIYLADECILFLFKRGLGGSGK